MADSKQYKQMATEILELVGGKENIASFTNCMTRLRVTVVNNEQVNVEKIEELEYVIQYQFVAGVHQIVLGPGIVQKVATEFGVVSQIASSEVINENLDQKVKESMGQRFIKLMQATMMPSIGALMGVALLNAVVTVLKISGVDVATNEFLNAVSVFATVGQSVLVVLMSINMAKYLQGNIYIAALFSIFLTSPTIADVTLFGQSLVAGVGGIIAALLTTALICFIEKQLKKVIPNAIQLFGVSVLTMLITLLILMYVIIPVSSVLTLGLVQIVTQIVSGNKIVFVLGCIIIGASYPYLVMTGMHMGIFIVLMPIFLETGQMPLIAAAFLGGAAQLGAATAVYAKERDDKKIRAIWEGGAPTAILGVIEPLMYGINLPRVKPLLAASIAAGIGGMFIGLLDLNMGYGMPGLLGVLSFDELWEMASYGAIWIGSVVLGFIICSVIYKKPVK